MSYEKIIPDGSNFTFKLGNSDGLVITREIDLDVEESFRGTAYTLNANRIMAYADYDHYTPSEQKVISADTPVIKWDKSASSGLKIQTNSESIVGYVYEGEEYLGSIIDSNMVLHEGMLQIGKSELVGLPIGLHKIRLVFDDGEVELTIKVTDVDNHPMKQIGDVDMNDEVEIIDVTVFQRYLGEFSELSYEQLWYADADNNGDVDIIDATLLQRYLVDFEVDIVS